MTPDGKVLDPKDPYVLEHLRQALTEDVRVGEPGIRVVSGGGRIWLTGQVGSESRRLAAEEVARETVPGVVIHNGLTVIAVGEPSVETVD